MQRAFVSILALVLTWAAAAHASAQARGPRLHLGVGLALDFAGEVEFDEFRIDQDLEPTIGVRGHFDYQVHRHVSVGGLTRLSWWEPDGPTSYDRSFLFDIGPRVIAHYDWRAMRFYSGLSLGLTVSAVDQDALDNPGFGPTLSLTVAGFEWWFARRTGLFAELGWVGHWFEHDVLGGARDVDHGLSQGLFEFGLVFGA